MTTSAPPPARSVAGREAPERLPCLVAHRHRRDGAPGPGPARRPRAGPQGAAPGGGHVPDRRRLLLHARLPAGHRRARRRSALPARHPRAGRADPARRAAGLPPGRRESPHGEGSIAMLERLLPLVAGQALRPGAARVRRHRLHHHDDPVRRRRLRAPRREPPRARLPATGTSVLDHPGPARRCWARCSCAGFTEAIGIAVVLVASTSRSTSSSSASRCGTSSTHPTSVTDWTDALTTQHGNPLMMVGVALLVFPKLALGMSGFETGVAVMPQVRGDAGDTEERPARADPRHQAAAHHGRVIMSVFLITSSLVDHAADPADGVRGRRRGQRPRAGLPRPRVPRQRLRHGLRRLHHRDPLVRRRLGDGRPAEPDPALPAALRHGARTGPRAVRPLVLVLTAAAFLITWIFDATSTPRAARTRPACWC